MTDILKKFIWWNLKLMKWLPFWIYEYSQWQSFKKNLPTIHTLSLVLLYHWNVINLNRTYKLFPLFYSINKTGFGIVSTNLLTVTERWLGETARLSPSLVRSIMVGWDNGFSWLSCTFLIPLPSLSLSASGFVKIIGRRRDP